MIGLTAGLLYHVATFPYPIGSTLKWTPANATKNNESVGCDPSDYKWCTSTHDGTMQGIMLMSGSLARTVGPLLVSWLFQVHGPVPVWGIELGTLGATLLLWLVFYRRLVPLKVRNLTCGEYMKYSNGVKYRM
ncbi:hypothetical protein TELCIR_17892 [Teladorsagia circumcincta]|uniref:Uncharacterized protein n=1 Tax=Teladorsagia circumcincta TaxID=45464 RepID=A0A2G9TRN8_TELCI|nr:hypothetical protein TELCIR_17892 [Teladorsagia circumcincta]